jgi:hypothetical protein
MAQIPTSVTSVKTACSHDRAAHTPSTSSAAPRSSPLHHHGSLGALPDSECR